MSTENTLDMEARYAHIKKGGVHLYIKFDGKLFGTLSVNDKSVVWKPNGLRKGIKKNWAAFDNVMRSKEVNK